MQNTITRDLVVNNGIASFSMKEYPNYCGIEDIGYISHGEWSDAELEYKGKLFNESVVSDVMYERFIEEFPDKDGDYEEFNKYMCDNKDEVYTLLENEADEKEYELTEKGRKECEIYIAELKTKRKEILDAGIDTADETFVDYTPEELFEDLLAFGIDEDGEIYNGYGVTDHYDADRAFGLKLGEDFIEVKK